MSQPLRPPCARAFLSVACASEGASPEAPFVDVHQARLPCAQWFPRTTCKVDIGKIMAVERPAARPQVLHRSYDVQAACLRLEWVVSARKLTSTDTHPHVSPAFELSFGEHCPSANFKMLIHPLVVNDKKGGGSFKKAGGRGYVEIACEQELPAGVPDVQFRISIGSGERRSVARGPVSHNFAERSVAGLPKKQGLWDFNVAVDRETHTFVVCLELLSSDSPPSSAPPARTDGNL